MVLCAAYAVTWLAVAIWRPSSAPLGDAIALWTWARFLTDHPAAEIYDPSTLHAGQVAAGLDPREYYPFAYPPSFLLVLRPLALLPYGVTPLTLAVLGLPLYLWATVGNRWRSPMALAALVAPTTAISIVAGQTGFLASALLIGGLRLTGRRPILAGLLLGLLTYKPQIGVLVPVALVSAKQWRCIATAFATFLMLFAVTSAVFGPEIWATWFAAIPGFSSYVAAEGGRILHLMPTVMSTLLQVGVAAPAARLVQAGVSVAMMGVVWASFRSGPTRLAAATLLVGTFLATPYAFLYDMPIVAAAVFWMIQERYDDGASFGWGEILVLTIAAIAPMMMPAETARLPVSAISLVLLLGIILRRAWTLRSRPRAETAAKVPCCENSS
jgi:alpha-1,2-mannosyltransferase